MRRNLRPTDPRLVRWYTSLPAIGLVLFVAVMAGFFWYVQRGSAEQAQQLLVRDTEWAQQSIRLRMRSNQDALVAQATNWNQIRATDPMAQTSLAEFLWSNPEVVYVAWIGADRLVRWSVPNQGSVLPIERVPGQALVDGGGTSPFDSARATRQPVYGALFRASGNEMVFELHLPVFVDQRFEGTVAVGYSLLRTLVYAVPQELHARYRLELVNGDGEVLAAAAQHDQRESVLRHELPLLAPGPDISLRASAFERIPTLIDRSMLAAVVALSLLILGSLYMLWRFSRQRFEAEAERDRLFNLSLDVLCVMNPNGGFVRVNPAFEDLFGRMRILGRLPEFVHPDQQRDVEQAISTLVREAPRRSSIAFEVRCLTRDERTYRWLSWAIRADRRQSPPTLYAVAHDITERVAAETALAAETAFRRAMEDSILTGMRAFDLTGRITYVNRAFCEMLGFTEAELLGASAPFAYWPRDKHDELRSMMSQVMSGSVPPGGLDVEVEHKDGRRLHVRMYVSPLVDRDGRHTGWMTSMTDITEPRRIRRELEAAHERFTTVLEELDAAVAVVARTSAGTTEVLFANRMCRELSDDASAGAERLARVAALGRPSPREVHDAASGRYFELRTREIRWTDGRQVEMIVATDVTARHDAEEMQRHHDERLQQTSRLITMGEMASSLAHELNQPLAAIANYTMGAAARVKLRASRGEPQVPEELLELLQKVARQAERAGEVIRRIRDFVKRSEPARAACTAETIVGDAVALAEIDAERLLIRLDVGIEADIPPLYVDPILIEQVLLNLIKNGIEAMRGVQRRPLEVRVRNLGAQIEFSVADRGPGISAAARDKLFEPFFTTKREGMGMGLNICRSIVEFHQGRLWVEDREGGGCVFRFTLPVAAQPAERAAA